MKIIIFKQKSQAERYYTYIKGFHVDSTTSLILGFQNVCTQMSQAERYSKLRFLYGCNIKFDIMVFKIVFTQMSQTKR